MLKNGMVTVTERIARTENINISAERYLKPVNSAKYITWSEPWNNSIVFVAKEISNRKGDGSVNGLEPVEWFDNTLGGLQIKFRD